MTLSNPFAGLAPPPSPRRAPLSVVELREAATAALTELMRVTERAGWDVATDLDVNRATSHWIECQGRYHRALVDSAKRHGDDMNPDA